METLLEQLQNTSLLEYIAVLTGISYVLFISYQQRIGWVFAFISTLIYTYLCIIAQLYIEASLQLFYVVMAVYGWIKWTNNSTASVLKIIQWPLKKHLPYLFLGGISTMVVGYTLSYFTNQASPYLDAFTTSFSLIATFMVARKILENWWYWIVIDFGLIFLYGSRGYVLTAVQYGLFTVLAFYGWIKWRKAIGQKM